VEQEQLGRGAFGVVVAAINRVDGRKYAIKKVRMDTAASGSWNVLREVSTLSGLQHAHIVRYFQAWRELSHPAAEGFDASASETSYFTTWRELSTPTGVSSANRGGVSNPGRPPPLDATPNHNPLPPVAEAAADESESTVAASPMNGSRLNDSARPPSWGLTNSPARELGLRTPGSSSDATASATQEESSSSLSTSDHSTGSALGAEGSPFGSWDWDRSRAVMGADGRTTQLWSEASALSRTTVLTSQAARDSLAVGVHQVRFVASLVSRGPTCNPSSNRIDSGRA
jgi:hypothetical protein